MKKQIGIIGSGGLIGSYLYQYLEKEYSVISIKSKFLYYPAAELAELIKDLNIIINITGYPIAGRWTRSVKELIYKSRIDTTHNLAQAVELLETKPDHVINASAVGIYKDDAVYDEKAMEFSDSFLGKLVQDWEKEANKIFQLGVKLTVLRLGVVLSRRGGAYMKMRKVFNLGIGGKIGSGKQGFSYILEEDVNRIVEFIIKNGIYGVVNAVAPQPVTNEIFTKALGRALNRPVIFSVPALVLKGIMGEGSGVLLDGQKVLPAVLLEKGFSFVGNNLTTCLSILEK